MTSPPAPPLVHAPLRPGGPPADAPTGNGPTTVVQGSATPPGPPVQSGARVTAVVGGAVPPPAVDGPVPGIAAPPRTPVPGRELPRTGVETVPVLLLALVLVLLACALQRLSRPDLTA